MSDEKNIHVDYDLVGKYLNSECSDEEIAQVEQWINASDAHRLEFSRLKSAWDMAGATLGQWHTQDSKEKFLLKLIQNQAAALGAKENLIQKKTRQMSQIWKYAAAAILIIGVSSVLVFTNPGNLSSGTFTEIAVSKGSKSQMTLPDGSQVWLNADSKLKYDQSFNAVDRDIELTGEAYFQVAKNPSKPFRVRACGLEVEAKGTAFNVKAYPEESVVEATLIEGIVDVGLVGRNEERLRLKPSEQVYYYKSDGSAQSNGRFLVSKGIATGPVTSWMKGQLEINGETLKSIAVKLSRQYDVKIEFDDPSIESLRFTGVFNNETIGQIMEVLKISSPVDYQIQDREIRLSRKPNSKNIPN